MSSRCYGPSREKELMLGRPQAGMRLLMWEESWAALRVGLGCLCSKGNDRRPGCYMWGVSAPAKQDSELTTQGGSLGIISWGESRVAGMTKQRYRARKSLLAQGVERPRVH